MLLHILLVDKLIEQYDGDVLGYAKPPPNVQIDAILLYYYVALDLLFWSRLVKLEKKLDGSNLEVTLMIIADFWEKFNQEWDATHRSTLVVQGDVSLADDISAYKLYINRNVHGTGARFAHLASPNSVYVRLKAGVYSVILREYDARKPDRMESNILHVQIHDNEQITIRASLLDGQLILFYDDIA
jgi:hypothetical protein